MAKLKEAQSGIELSNGIVLPLVIGVWAAMMGCPIEVVTRAVVESVTLKPEPPRVPTEWHSICDDDGWVPVDSGHYPETARIVLITCTGSRIVTEGRYTPSFGWQFLSGRPADVSGWMDLPEPMRTAEPPTNA